jgi:hypothetical protein
MDSNVTPPMPPSDPAPAAPPPGDGGVRQWSVILHVSSLVGLVVPVFGNILAPLTIWLLKKQELPGIDPVGRQVLNFQISWTIWILIASGIAAAAACLILPLVIPLGLAIAWLVFTIMGAVKASDGVAYAHPWTLKLL